MWERTVEEWQLGGSLKFVPPIKAAMRLFMDAVPRFMDAMPLVMAAIPPLRAEIPLFVAATPLFVAKVPLFMAAMPPFLAAVLTVWAGAGCGGRVLDAAGEAGESAAVWTVQVYPDYP